MEKKKVFVRGMFIDEIKTPYGEIIKCHLTPDFFEFTSAHKRKNGSIFIDIWRKKKPDSFGTHYVTLNQYVGDNEKKKEQKKEEEKEKSLGKW